MKKTIILVLILSSCSVLTTWNESEVLIGDTDLLSDKDYIEHLSFVATQYLEYDKKNIIKLKRKQIQYLTMLYKKIISSNEHILTKDQKPSFFIIKNKIPFIFSFPGNNYFISTNIIKKYLKHEYHLISALTNEIIRSQLYIYKRYRIVPTGNVNLSRVLALTRIPVETKLEVDKLTFFAMKRAGLDPMAYLMWLQIQNKNALDFVEQYGNAILISKEEFMFKNFISKERIEESERANINSSKFFYQFIKEVSKEKR